jgi:hypothetical protein
MNNWQVLDARIALEPQPWVVPESIVDVKFARFLKRDAACSVPGSGREHLIERSGLDLFLQRDGRFHVV